jgi:hypothetical protein
VLTGETSGSTCDCRGRDTGGVGRGRPPRLRWGEQEKPIDLAVCVRVRGAHPLFRNLGPRHTGGG